jgi:hypothetical protein
MCSVLSGYTRQEDVEGTSLQARIVVLTTYELYITSSWLEAKRPQIQFLFITQTPNNPDTADRACAKRGGHLASTPNARVWGALVQVKYRSISRFRMALGDETQGRDGQVNAASA